MKHIALFFSGLFFLSFTTSVYAQDAKQMDNEKISFAKQVLEINTPDDFNKHGGDLFILQLTPPILRDNPGQEDKIKQILQATVEPLFASIRDASLNRSAELLAKNFSEEELRQIYSFVSSSVGKKYYSFDKKLAQKLREAASADADDKVRQQTRDALHAAATQLRLNGMKVPAEIEK